MGQAPSTRTASRAKKFEHKFKKARVTEVYDGDTITVAAFSPRRSKNCYIFKIRLSGIDCPELRTKNEKEKKCGYIARDFLRSKILGKVIKIKLEGFDKYGRLLGTIKRKGLNLNEEMVKKGLAVSYEGKTKGKINWESLIKGKSPHLYN